MGIIRKYNLRQISGESKSLGREGAPFHNGMSCVCGGGGGGETFIRPGVNQSRGKIPQFSPLPGGSLKNSPRELHNLLEISESGWKLEGRTKECRIFVGPPGATPTYASALFPVGESNLFLSVQPKRFPVYTSKKNLYHIANRML